MSSKHSCLKTLEQRFGFISSNGSTITVPLLLSAREAKELAKKHDYLGIMIEYVVGTHVVKTYDIFRVCKEKEVGRMRKKRPLKNRHFMNF